VSVVGVSAVGVSAFDVSAVGESAGRESTHHRPLIGISLRSRNRRRARHHPRALLIDAMGTLVRLRAPVPLLRSQLRDRFGVRVSEAEAAAALRAEITFYRAHMGEGRDAETLHELRLRCAAVLRDALPAGCGALGLDELLRGLLTSLRFVAFDDARDALLAVRARGVSIVAVSNWDVSVLEVLEQTGLAPLLDGAVSSASIGVGKPSPVVFEHALSLAGARAADALHVGDSPSEDVAGALAAGIEPLLIDRAGDGARVAGVRTIRGLDELGWPPVPGSVAGP
jgi:putative hydrolase of the HAD superfamily